MDRIFLGDRDLQTETDLPAPYMDELVLSSPLRQSEKSEKRKSSGATLAHFVHFRFDSVWGSVFSAVSGDRTLPLLVVTRIYVYVYPNAFHKLSSWMPSFEISTGLTLSTNFRGFGASGFALVFLSVARLYLHMVFYTRHSLKRVCWMLQIVGVARLIFMWLSSRSNSFKLERIREH